MNATPAVSQAPSANDPTQASGAVSADSTRSSANSQDFAAALTDADPKPTRKPAGNKAHDGAAAGGQLPVAGSLSPPATLPVMLPVTSAAASASSAVSVTNARGVMGATAPAPSGGVPGAVPDTGTGAGAGSTSGTSPGAAFEATMIPGAQGKAAGLNPGGAALDPPAAASGATAAGSLTAGFAQALGLPVADPKESGAPAASAAPPAASAAPLAAPPLGTAAENAVGRWSVAATAATAAATSGPSTADGGASTNTDATAQTPTTAALAAAVSGVVAASDAGYAGAADSPSSPTDDLATPATGGVAADAAGLNGAAVPALSVAAIAHAAVVATATTPINAQAVAALAGAGTPDKHSQAGSGNSLLTDASGNSITGTAQIATTGTIASDVSPTPTLKVGAAVETPEFGQGLADRVSWMVDNNLNGAKLQVNPPQLGPIEVRIAVQGGHAQVWLTSHSAVTRDALEASSAKLREMLGAQGFGQVSVDISQRSFQERSSQAQPYDWTPAANRAASPAAPSSAAVSMPRISSGAVDAYA